MHASSTQFTSDHILASDPLRDSNVTQQRNVFKTILARSITLSAVGLFALNSNSVLGQDDGSDDPASITQPAGFTTIPIQEILIPEAYEDDATQPAIRQVGLSVVFSNSDAEDRKEIDKVLDEQATRANQDEETDESSGKLEAYFADSSNEIDLAAPPTEPEFSEEMLALRARIQDVIEYHRSRPENAASRSPWGVMHSMIAYGVDTELIVQRDRVNAIGWLCWNGSCRGQRLFYTDRSGNMAMRVGPGFQGHDGQFLAMLAQCRVKPDYQIKINGKEFTIEDLIEYEQVTCRPRSELTFKLIALSYYLDSDATWKSRTGQTWSIPRLIQEELAQPVIGAACGGTHRLMGFSYAVRMREKRGEPIDGQWLRAKKYIDDYMDYAFRLQNRDGSFSTKWFEGRESKSDAQRRLQTTGHILEWMVFSLPRDQVEDPRIVKCADYLANLMWRNRNVTWEVGPKGHAIRALSLFEQRVFDSNVGNYAPELANKKNAADAGGTEPR